MHAVGVFAVVSALGGHAPAVPRPTGVTIDR
jgi:hypothetical protein